MGTLFQWFCFPIHRSLPNRSGRYNPPNTENRTSMSRMNGIRPGSMGRALRIGESQRIRVIRDVARGLRGVGFRRNTASAWQNERPRTRGHNGSVPIPRLVPACAFWHGRLGYFSSSLACRPPRWVSATRANSCETSSWPRDLPASRSRASRSGFPNRALASCRPRPAAYPRQSRQALSPEHCSRRVGSAPSRFLGREAL